MPASEVKTLSLTVDGKPVTVPEGTTVLQACEKAGSPVPFYCYHPGLSIAGNCRICLVEIDKNPKLQISCYLRAAEGMAVKTTTDPVLKGRQDVLEFLLANHPLDCPVCDQAGECWLQDYYMQYGLYDQKFDEQKVKKPKAVPIGPHVMLDAERCILCSRCVRFTDEISKTSELGIFNRGDHAEIGVAPGKQLDNNYSGCVVDICPVGALTDRDFRFKCRVWYLSATKSVCPGCSKGCNIEIHNNRELKDRPHVAGGARVMRLKPRYHPDVNQWWMCDTGRYAYKSIDENRLAQVQIRPDGRTSIGAALRQASWSEAIELLATTIDRLTNAKQLDRVGVILSTHMSNEDLYVAKKIFTGLEIAQVQVQGPPVAASDGFLLQPDRSPNTRGAQALKLPFNAKSILERAMRKELSMLYVFGHDLATLAPLYGAGLAGSPQAAQEIARAVELLVFQGSNINATSQAAHLILPSAVYAEKDGTFTNGEGRVQRFWPAFPPMGEAKPDWQILFELAKRLDIPWGFHDAASVFKNMTTHEPAFEGLDFDALADQGALLKQ